MQLLNTPDRQYSQMCKNYSTTFHFSPAAVVLLCFKVGLSACTPLSLLPSCCCCCCCWGCSRCTFKMLPLLPLQDAAAAVARCCWCYSSSGCTQLSLSLLLPSCCCCCCSFFLPFSALWNSRTTTAAAVTGAAGLLLLRLLLLFPRQCCCWRHFLQLLLQPLVNLHVRTYLQNAEAGAQTLHHASLHLRKTWSG